MKHDRCNHPGCAGSRCRLFRMLAEHEREWSGEGIVQVATLGIELRLHSLPGYPFCRLAMVLRMHSGRRSSIDPASRVLPDSLLARDAEVAAQDLLTPVLLTIPVVHTRGARPSPHFTITFDRELLPVPGCNVPRHRDPEPGARRRLHGSQRRVGTVSSPTATTCLPIIASLLPTRSPCTTPPASASNPVPRPTSYLPARPSMCSAFTATRYPMQSARASSRSTRGWASSGSSPGFCEPRPSKSLAAAPGTCTASP